LSARSRNKSGCCINGKSIDRTTRRAARQAPDAPRVRQAHKPAAGKPQASRASVETRDGPARSIRAGTVARLNARHHRQHTICSASPEERSSSGNGHQEHVMTDLNPSFFGRMSIAFGTFFSVLGNAEFAGRVKRLRDAPQAAAAPTPAPATAAAPARPAPVAPTLKEASPEAALQLLGLLQRDARLIDFIEEDIASYTDADIGAAARLVHDGCRAVLREHFTIRPVRDEAEGSRVTLPDGFDATAIRLTGNVVGKPPFNGSISHRGWKVAEVRLPKLAESHDARVVAPAEVEL
jgi:hypothetical protein